MFGGQKVVKVLGKCIGFEYRCLKSPRLIEPPLMAGNGFVYNLICLVVLYAFLFQVFNCWHGLERS
jgi:hypothetical protein